MEKNCNSPAEHSYLSVEGVFFFFFNTRPTGDIGGNSLAESENTIHITKN